MSLAYDTYLTTQVLSASPQKLHLMLIEAALRYSQQAREHWQAAEHEAAGQALIRAREMVGEMLAGLNPAVEGAPVARVAAEYTFIFRSLLQASLHHDEAKLAGAIRVLEVERETWRQLCEQLAGESSPAAGAAVFPTLDAPRADVTTGLSLDA